jgi:hypothetical protein
MADEKKDEEKKEEAEAKEEKKDEKKAEADSKEDKEEKKEKGGFSKWWHGTSLGKSIDKDNLEAGIRRSYEDNHHGYDFYSYESQGLFGGSERAYGDVADGKLVVYGHVEAKEGSVVIDLKDKKAYYVKSSKKVDVKSTYESTEYTREGTEFELDPKVDEVNVIKADGRYFIYHGEVEKKDSK